MSRLNRKHVARVNQQLNGHPSQTPNGCAQLAGIAFPAEFTEKPADLIREPSPWLAAQCPVCVGEDLFAGSFLPPLFSLIWWHAGERQVRRGSPFPYHRIVQAFDVCLDDRCFPFQEDAEDLSCRVGTWMCSSSESGCCAFHE